MARDDAPPEIIALARDRASARAARDWATADRLREQIEAAGWRIVDEGTAFRLERAHAPTVETGGRIRYGTSAAVPSRLDDAAVGTASVVLAASDWPEDLARAYRGLTETSPDGTQIVIVANAPPEGQSGILDDVAAADPGAPGIVTEVVWTSDRLGHAAALNAGLRRTRAPVAILLDTSVEPQGDVVTPLVEVLADPAVGVTGPFGIISPDLRQFEDAPPGTRDVDAIEGYLLAFRRSDLTARGPLDEHFGFYRNLDIWWSLVLRDEGEGRPPRRAVRVEGLPVARHEHRGWSSVPEEERDRLSRRNFYRVLKRFATRRDLLVAPGRPTSGQGRG